MFYHFDAAMLPFKRTFESEKHQLQELNARLHQYLSRTKQLEQENVLLIAEINKLRQGSVAQREPRYKDEMRELRRMVAQLSFDKSCAEMEREQLWRELQTVQSLCCEQTEVCRGVSGELSGCEKELQHAHKTNTELQRRLLQLEDERGRLEEAHGREMERFRLQVESRVSPIIAQTYCGPPAATVEEVHEYARGVSEGWIDTFDMYQHKVEEMEGAIKADQATLRDLQQEKMMYASELDKMSMEAEQQGQVQVRLEEQLMHMQDRFHHDCSEYQMIIEQLEHERNVMAGTIAEKMREHQHLLQVKMDLGMEVAAYRALLEGERVGVNQHQRERVIDIKMPAQPYSPRASTLTTRQHMDIRYTPSATNLRRSPVPPSGSRSPSRVIPISLSGRGRHQSSASSRRDMISFAKAQAATSSSSSSSTNFTTTMKDKQMGHKENQIHAQKAVVDKAGKNYQVSLEAHQVSPIESSTDNTKSVKVVSPPMMSLGTNKESGGQKQVSNEKGNDSIEERREKEEKPESRKSLSEKKVFDTVSVEEIIEKVIKPVSLEGKGCSLGESNIKYHIEKTEEEDGTTKMQIVLESKVEEELDVSQGSALDEVLGQGVKKVSLEDIKDTATGLMIKNLLSGLQESEDLGNKSVNVEIIEEPVETYSDEELEMEKKSSLYEPSTTYFQIEELENVSHEAQIQRGEAEVTKTSMIGSDKITAGSVQEQDPSDEPKSYFSHDQDPHDYFVSTPDEDLSDHEEGGGITSYGHYGILEDLSDERYYQDDSILPRKVIVEESDEYDFRSGSASFVKDSFPECIIEEEVRVSPVVQESVLELLREDSLEPKEQLKGALEKLQSSVSVPLKEELAFLTRMSRESPDNVSVDVKKVQQSNDNGTTTIVAELNVSQTLEESGLLETGNDLSEEQIMAALKSSDLGLEKVLQGGAGGEYRFKVSTEEAVTFEDFQHSNEGESEITGENLKLGPSKKSFTFKMSHAEAPDLQSQIATVTEEKRIATVFLESPTDE